MVRSLWLSCALVGAIALLARTPEQRGQAEPPSPLATRAAETNAVAEALAAHTPPHIAAAKQAPAKPVLHSGEAVVEKALETPAAAEFIETPLQDAVDFLKEYLKIEILLDRKPMEEANIGADVAVTLNMRGLPLATVLHHLLKPHGLTWTVQDGVLLITTPEAEESRLTTRLYDVADLVVCRDSKNQLWDDYETLTDLITTTVAVTTWDTVGGPGSITGASIGTAKVLVISQTYRVHREIATLLADIRKIAAKRSGGDELPRRDKVEGGHAFSGFRGCAPIASGGCSCCPCRRAGSPPAVPAPGGVPAVDVVPAPKAKAPEAPAADNNPFGP
jgi:hypothetical protein